MTRVVISSNEWYPVYSVERGGTESRWDDTADVPESALKRWEKAEAAFKRAQDEIQAVIDKEDQKARKARIARGEPAEVGPSWVASGGIFMATHMIVEGPMFPAGYNPNPYGKHDVGDTDA